MAASPAYTRNEFETRGNIANQAGQQNIYGDQIFHIRDEDLLDKLPRASQAAFNSFDDQHDPLCLPNTRVDVLEQIMAWADGDDERCIFWLNGMAGTGKSTIARTVAHIYHNKNLLGASFFFSRGGGDVSRADKFFTSIAVQLSSKLSAFKQHIGKTVAEHPDIAGRAPREQWKHLILQPLSKLDADSIQSPLLLVVDALDECESDSDIRSILQLLTEARNLHNFQLRIFLTSRPEIAVRHGFRDIPKAEHQDFVLHNISRSIVDHDISVFLHHHLGVIRREYSLPANWPGEQAIVDLVHHSGGLYIWAATACRFIREGRLFAIKRLARILQHDTAAATPEENLNQIYTAILANSIRGEYDDGEKEDFCHILKDILGTIVILFSSLSPVSLATLLYIPRYTVDLTLDDMHSILEVPRDQGHQIRLHHPSFRDFLLDRQRCRDLRFWVDEEEAHQALAESCMRLMSDKLKRDICGLHAVGTLASDVDSGRIEQCLPSELQYACQYWVRHLRGNQILLLDNGPVHAFLRERLLNWLEALSLMRKTSEGVQAITSLESMVIAEKAPSFYAFIHDAKRFALYNRSIVEKAPLQIYCSGLVFAPEKSIVRKQFTDQIPNWMYRLPRVQKNWNSLLQTLEGHSDFVSAVAFSPDGKLLASASHDNTVRVWDPATGASLQTLEGHSHSVFAVAFSPDGKLLVSVSGDHTVRVWDPDTGASLQTLEGHSHSVLVVVFSPDGKLLTSASDDNTVRVWDPDTGASLQTLEGHSHSVFAVAFSPDGKLLASASHDHTVRVWGPDTGASLQTLKGHSDFVYAVVFSPDGKLLTSASDDNTVRIWDPDTGASLQTLEGHSDSVYAVAFSPDGKLLASASHDHTVRVWDPATGASLQMLEDHAYSVYIVVLSPDGKLLASISRDNTVRVWDPATGASLWTLEGHSDFVSAAVFSPDGKLLASASHDQTVRVWDLVTGASLQTLEGHLRFVSAVVFSPDGKLLASASYDGTVRVWDPATGASLQTLKGHSHSGLAVAFSPGGELPASASRDQTVRVWDSATGASLRMLETNVIAWELSFSSDGQYLNANRGQLSISPLGPSVISPQSNRRGIEREIFVNKAWVAQGIKNILWLPPDYRATCAAVWNNVLAIGHASGRVSVLGFNAAEYII